MASVLTLAFRRHGKDSPSLRKILRLGNNAPSSSASPPNSLRPPRQCRTAATFKPRRTPPPSIAGVNLRPRPNPNPSLTVASIPGPPVGGEKKYEKDDDKLLGGEGRDPNWLSPHHIDYYGRVDDSTLNHPELLHGDPHMPIQRLTRGDGRVILDPLGRRATEETELSRKKDALVASLDNYDNLEAYLAADGDNDDGGKGKGDSEEEEDFDYDMDDDDEEDYIDDLEREFGETAADAIRSHLNSFHARLRSAERRGTNKFSPLDEVEEKFRMIDRFTSMEGSTHDLALRRRARTEGREFYRLGTIPKLTDGQDGSGDEFHVEGSEETGNEASESEKEFGKGRGYDAQSVFGKGAKVHFPHGKDWPSPTYHPDFPEGSNRADNPNNPDEEKWMHELNRLISEERAKELELGDIDETLSPVNVQKEDMDVFMKEWKRTKRWDMLRREDHELDREEKPDEILEMIKNNEDPNQEAFGPWGEMTIKVDRVQKVERGGTTVRYRALVIGGNGNGAAGFGIGKSGSPNEAIVKACKHCKRNVFYVDRYLGSGLSYDLAGKHNSCKVHLRAVKPDYGLHGHPLIIEILKYAGISDATCKSHGNRNPYNVVYATFKALMTHESLEEIAMKRGKKLLNLQRARRLGIA